MRVTKDLCVMNHLFFQVGPMWTVAIIKPNWQYLQGNIAGPATLTSI